MIDHNHPAVEAVAREIYAHDAPSNDPQTWPPTPTALADDYRGAAIATLPDGTRARRDGEREDGEPRFVKVQEGEK